MKERDRALFFKANGNCDGYLPEKGSEQFPDTPQHARAFFLRNAFSHYSYESSRGQLMLLDFQCNPETLKCTDFVKVEPTDIYPDDKTGKHHMASFFQTHKCNEFCRALKLEVHTGDPVWLD